MSELPPSTNPALPADDEPRASRDTSQNHPAQAIRSVSVEYEDRSDRLTIYPRGCPSPALMTTWLTADRDAFIGLLSAR